MCGRANSALRTIREDLTRIVAYFNYAVFQKILFEQAVLGSFDEAMESGQFKMYLQPQVTKDGNVIGAEALARWQRPDGTMVMPGDFIETLETAGLIHKLDSYIWELAVCKLREWKHTEFKDLHISINISPKDMELMDVFKVITDLVHKYDVDPSRLHLEITESFIIKNPSVVNNLIMRLKEAGFLIEIDDFGSGYSSLNMLKDINADVIKIDTGFLSKSLNEDRGEIILDSIIFMAKRLGIGTVTEGVETPNQFAMLNAMGCDVYQGYLFSKPVSVKEFENKYSNLCRKELIPS
jgi:EAL domain-containing protein (putative c-di-GMP-specific phosphodiesterase class I)